MNTSGKTSVLVTGASGFIGRHLVARLSQNPHLQIVQLTRTAAALPAISNVQEVNCALDKLTSGVWRDSGVDHIDWVFHLGGFIPKTTSVGDAVEEVYRDNLLGTRALLGSLPSRPGKVLFASTVDVYAPADEAAVLSEQSPLGPCTLYGASKLFCENLIQAYSRAQGCECVLLRYGHIYGPGEGAYAKLIPQVIKAMLRNEAPMLYGDGSTLRDYLFVGDAVEATVRAAAASRATGGPLNIVSGVSRPIREYVDIIAEIVGFSGDIQYLSNKPGGRSLRFDNSRMTSVLGHWAPHPLMEGLRQEIEYFKAVMSNKRGVLKTGPNCRSYDEVNVD